MVQIHQYQSWAGVTEAHLHLWNEQGYNFISQQTRKIIFSQKRKKVIGLQNHLKPYSSFLYSVGILCKATVGLSQNEAKEKVDHSVCIRATDKISWWRSCGCYLGVHYSVIISKLRLKPTIDHLLWSMKFTLSTCKYQHLFSLRLSLHSLIYGSTAHKHNYLIMLHSVSSERSELPCTIQCWKETGFLVASVAEPNKLLNSSFSR